MSIPENYPMVPTIDDLHGIPLTGLIARRFVLELFKQRSQWNRQDLAIEVDRMHKNRGGIRGAQVPVRVVKKVLSELKEEGELVNVAKGIWRTTGTAASTLPPQETPPAVDVLLNPDDEIQDEEEEVEIVESIGHGPESVYVYYNPNDQELAKIRGLDYWECKVGRTQGDVASRILDQGAKTALSHQPIVGLVIQTDNAAQLEAALHASLLLADRPVLDSPGVEWYFTSPSKVKAWYNLFLEGVVSLSNRGPA